jgi:hypothetical protein
MDDIEEDGGDPRLEARLSEALEGQGYRPEGVHGERVDRAVLAIVEARIDRIGTLRGRKRTRRIAWFSGAAAAAAILVAGVFVAAPRRSGPPPQQVALRERPRTPKRVDIVDAYLLAARLRSGETVSPRYDLNEDGRVDLRDVDRLARSAVSLSHGAM